MNILKIIKYIFIFIYILSLGYANAAINYTLTPLKYEIEAEPGEVINRSAQIRNNGSETVTLGTATSDFEAKGTNGIPTFVRYSELVNLEQELSSWISINQASITLAPGETKGITFTITVPENATPGGHYAAVFFKNPNSELSSSAEIAIKVDYGVLLLVNVEGEIVVDIDIEPIIIGPGNGGGSSGGGWGGGASSGYVKDSCPFGDLTSSNFDRKCIDNFLNPAGKNNVIEGDLGNENFTTDTGESNVGKNSIMPPLENFEINFNLPINNNGNTHIQPIGKIKLVDENGKEIKSIGKEVKKNDYGAVIGEEIVDYLPLNDEGGKVLPNTKRNFEASWKGFPYKEYNENGDPIINYWNPGEYYTSENKAENRFMMPWERVYENIKTKKVKALIEVAYKDANGDDVQYNSADEFEIEYKEQYIGLNPYVIIPFFLLIGFWLLFWLILAKKKKICINKDCEEKGTSKKKKKETTKIKGKSDKEKNKKEKTKKKKL